MVKTDPLIALWTRARTTRRSEPGARPPWRALLPVAGDDAACLFCGAAAAACACECVRCSARRDRCACALFITRHLPEVHAAFSEGKPRVIRRAMRGCLGSDERARRRLCQQKRSYLGRADGGGDRCAICSESTVNGCVGLCNACRNQAFIRQALRAVPSKRRR